ACDWACCPLERHRPERAPPALQFHRVVLREPRPGGGRDGRLPGDVRGMGGPAAIPAGLRAGDRPHGRGPGAHARLPPDGSRGLQARDPAGGSALRDAAVASLGLELVGLLGACVLNATGPLEAKVPHYRPETWAFSA